MPERFSFQAISSTPGNFYQVEFVFNDSTTAVHCSCIAGGLGQLCKHKTAFLIGDQTILAQGSDIGIFEDLQRFVHDAGLRTVHDGYLFAIGELDNQKKELQKTIEPQIKALDNKKKQLKIEFERRLREGI